MFPLNSVAVHFSQNNEPAFGRIPIGGRPRATLIGSFSIFLWAVWPSLAVFAAPTPTFQILAIGMTIGFLTLAAIRVMRGGHLLDMLPNSMGLLVAGVIGILGTNAFNFIAVTRISPASASVIAYLWPMLALLLAGALRLKVLTARHYLAIVSGFFGAMLVIDPFGPADFDAIGVACAFLAGLSFATYTTYRMIDDRSPSDAVGIYSLVAAIVCGIVHFQFETTLPMTIPQILAVIALGLAPMGLANAFWDHGVAKGDARTMSILAYGTPLVAALLLVLLGLADLTPMLVAGAAFIVLGAAIGTWPSGET